jgi:hypothetical protein
MDSSDSGIPKVVLLVFAALPQHMAVSLRLTIEQTPKSLGGYASRTEAEA